MRHILNAYKMSANFIQTIPVQSAIDISDTTPLTMRKIGIFVWIGQLVVVVLPTTIIAIGNTSRIPRKNRRAKRPLHQHPIKSPVDIELGIKDLKDRLNG